MRLSLLLDVTVGVGFDLSLCISLFASLVYLAV
jgi:hypothetical protein